MPTNRNPLVPPPTGPSLVSAVVNRILRTRIISPSDQKLLVNLLNRSILSEADMDLINHVYLGLHDGLLRVVD